LKTFAIVLVVAVAGYAVYELFKGNLGLKAASTPSGQITSGGQSVPGVPVYSSIVAQASNFAGTALGGSTAITQALDAFGPTSDSSDESDSDDFTGAICGNTPSVTAGSYDAGGYDYD
jgi:hypothetical protein